MRIVERLKLHTSWRDSHGELNDAPNEAAALLEQAEAALKRSAKAGQRVLEAMDDYNEKRGTYLGGPAYFEIGRAVAQNRALLAKLHEGGE